MLVVDTKSYFKHVTLNTNTHVNWQTSTFVTRTHWKNNIILLLDINAWYDNWRVWKQNKTTCTSNSYYV